jgi:23S rRNA (guanosine2251-2'-O)-methyltransferase
MTKKVILILDNIRSVHNAGSLFRTADGCGVSEIFLCGTTPTPIDRFGRARSDFAKVSLGSEKTISWKFFGETSDAIGDAKKEGYHIILLEQDSQSVSYDTKIPHEKIALVLGPEVSGMSEEIISLADTIIEIPMRGQKESLNVSVAGGIAMYEIMKKE